MEGGLESSRPGLDGVSEVRTLDDYRLGKADYVTGASDPSRYGETYEIPKITYTSPLDGKSYTLDDVPVYVHDTGNAFDGRPDKLDIAVGNVGNDAQAETWSARQQFLNDSPVQLAQAEQAPPIQNLGSDASSPIEGDTRQTLAFGENPPIQEVGSDVTRPVQDDQRQQIAFGESPAGSQGPRVFEAAHWNPQVGDSQVAGNSVSDYQAYIPKAEWMPEVAASGEEVTQSVQDTLNHEGEAAQLQDRLAQADQETAVYQAQLPDIDTKSPEEMKQIEQAQLEDRLAQAPEPARAPTVSERISAWWDEVRGVSSNAPVTDQVAGTPGEENISATYVTDTATDQVEGASGQPTVPTTPSFDASANSTVSTPSEGVISETLPNVTDQIQGTPGQPNIPATMPSASEPVVGGGGKPTIPATPVPLGVAESLPITASVPVPMAAPYPKSGIDSGYSGGSVKDYFESIGQDSSYAFRKEVATAYGIQGFRGTSSQNSQLLRLMRGY
jgi:hypothetical protein